MKPWPELQAISSHTCLCHHTYMHIGISITMYECVYIYVRVKVLVTQLCLCDPMDCSPPGSSICGILQAGILEWIAMPFSKGCSQPRDQTWVSHMAGKFFSIWATRKVFFFFICAYIQSILVVTVVLFSGRHRHGNSEHWATAPKGNIGLGSRQPLVTFLFTGK